MAEHYGNNNKGKTAPLTVPYPYPHAELTTRFGFSRDFPPSLLLVSREGG